jgi:hypothetical protein
MLNTVMRNGRVVRRVQWAFGVGHCFADGVC